MVFVLSCSCFPLGECVRGRNEQTPGNSVGCGISLYMCPQGRGCRYQTSLFLPIQGRILIFSSFIHCSDVLRFCMPGCGVGRCSAHHTVCPPSLLTHVFLHEGFSKMAHPTLTTSFSLSAFILVCKVKYLYLLILKDFFPSTHPFIHLKIFIIHLLCAWHSCRHEG